MAVTRKVGVITQARATSTRLPRKILLPVGGKTFLDHHLDRVALSNLPVVVATTVNAADDPIVELVTGRGLAGVSRQRARRPASGSPARPRRTAWTSWSGSPRTAR